MLTAARVFHAVPTGWFPALFVMAKLQDTPLGPVVPQESDRSVQDADERSIIAQGRLVTRMRKLWPMPAACLIVGIVLVALGS